MTFQELMLTAFWLSILKISAYNRSVKEDQRCFVLSGLLVVLIQAPINQYLHPFTPRPDLLLKHS